MYDHIKVEEKWQKIWESNQLFQQSEKGSKDDSENIYLLFAFAYPSGSGLHVGHVESKTALDILARYYRMKGKNVFFPVGWDAFGLPAENYAIKTGIHPSETTASAIDTFRRQIKRIGISYDWKNEIATSHPEYYKWTQWLFIQLFQKGLAYQKDGKVNWCPSCQTVLANEQVVDGLCERCDHEVIQKDMKQWYYQITKYQDELITGLDQVDWPSATKAQQLNWIGKKTGINIIYKIKGLEKNSDVSSVVCFTTRPDTNFGATFIVIAPEHELAKKVATGEIQSGANSDLISSNVAEYLDQATKKTELDRQQEGKQKTGVFTGLYAKNDLNDKEMPIWISDFVLGGFGTGAVVGVPGHDTRDFEFAKFVNSLDSDGSNSLDSDGSKNNGNLAEIEVIRVVVGEDGDQSKITSVDQVQEEQGTMINSGFLNGMEINLATEKIMDYMEEKGWGKRVTSYRLRDWLISRQRYWGTPIPIVYDPDGNPHAIEKSNLPWTLPTDVDFNPTGESPLKSSLEFADRTKKYVAKIHENLIKEKGWAVTGEGWIPEFDTMDTFVDSSWYFLRYLDSRNKEAFARPEQLEKWLPVDLYMIGPEHIVLHLLYSRFFTKFLRDEGYLKFDEPFSKMRHQGMILGPDNKKMSKSKGNVISPDEIVEKFGADTLRVYEMFMGPLESDKPWDIRAVIGIYKFLQKINRLVSESKMEDVQGENKVKLQRKLHQVIKKTTDDILKLKFNTAIAFMMEFVNLWQDIVTTKNQTLSNEDKVAFIKVLSPFAPFLGDELFEFLSKNDHSDISDINDQNLTMYSGVHVSEWPKFDNQMAKEDVVKIPIQINGKVRGQLEIDADEAENEAVVIEMAIKIEAIQKYLDNKAIKKKIYIKGKIISLVV